MQRRRSIRKVLQEPIFTQNVKSNIQRRNENKLRKICEKQKPKRIERIQQFSPALSNSRLSRQRRQIKKR